MEFRGIIGLNTPKTWEIHSGKKTKIIHREWCSRWQFQSKFHSSRVILLLDWLPRLGWMIQSTLLFNPKLTEDTHSCVNIMGYKTHRRNRAIFDYSFWNKADCLQMIHSWTDFAPRLASAWKPRSAHTWYKHLYNKTVDNDFKMIISLSKGNWILDRTCLIKDHPSDFTYN